MTAPKFTLSFLVVSVAAAGLTRSERPEESYLEVLDKLTKAKTKEERRAVLRGKPDEFLTGEFLTKLFQEQSRLLDAGEFARVEQLQTVAEAAAGAIDDADTRELYEWLCLLGKGKNSFAAGRVDEAVEASKKALAEARKKGWKTLEFAVLSNLGACQIEQGDFAGAVKTLEEVRAGQAGLNDFARQLVESRALGNLGQVYADLGDYTRAVKTLEESLRLAAKAGDAATARNARLNLAAVQIHQGRYPEAIRAYEQLLADARKARQPLVAGKVLNNLGLALGEQGRAAEAVRRFEEARDLAREYKLRRNEAMALGNLAVLHFKLGSEDDADRYNREALKLFRAVGDKAGIARCLRLTAGFRPIIAGQAEEAERLLAEAAELIKAGGSRAELAQLQLAMADAHLARGDIPKTKDSLRLAEEHYRAAGDLSRAVQLRYTRALLRGPDGKIYSDEDELKLVYAEMIRLGDPRLKALAHEDLGFAFYMKGHWREATKQWREAVRIAEGYRAAIGDSFLRAADDHRRLGSSSSVSLPFLYTAIAVSLAQAEDPAGSFDASDRGKARSLGELLDRNPVRVRKGVTTAEQAEEEQLRQAVAAAASRLHSGLRFQSNEPAVRDQMARQLQEAEATYEEFRRKLFADHPGLAGQRAELPPVDLAELQTTVFAGQPDLAVLSYVVAWDRTLVILATAADQPGGQARVIVREAKVTYPAVEQAAKDFGGACQNPAAGRPTSDELWAWLITPVEKELEGKKQLVIVPSRPLIALPFQALRKDGGPYLIEQFAVSYAPSVSALMEMRRRGDRVRAAAGGPARVPVVAVGGVNFTRDLKDLPHSGPEAETIGRLFGKRSRILVGDRATRAGVAREAGAARVLHFATHGLVNPARPLFSALAVTPDGDDGRLYAHDMMNLDLSAELVVLSACETALGREYVGEGTIGLAWALFVAGSPAVVVSQWPVADESTGRLMEVFYGGFAGDASKAEALRQAQLSLLKDKATRHPFYWAPFVLIGDWRK
ncbi:MAG: hypothetical protein JWO38_3421 [Gemmataceae bacterium]|nr:hypothetical protein [Gemmataceae bacterium]